MAFLNVIQKETFLSHMGEVIEIEKVKITQVQADAIEIIKRDMKSANYFVDNLMIQLNKEWTEPKLVKLNKLSIKEYLDALYIGYEVEPNFEVGDWIKDTETNAVLQIKNKQHRNNCLDRRIVSLRHATQEEIEQEKERRWWKKNGREVQELKQGDILMATHRHIFEITADPKSHRFNQYTGDDAFDFSIEEFTRKNWKVICFSENREDV